MRQWLPYDQDSTEELPLKNVGELRLRVGYLVDEPGLELTEAKDSEGKPYKYPAYGKALKAQKILESGPISVPSSGARWRGPSRRSTSTGAGTSSTRYNRTLHRLHP